MKWAALVLSLLLVWLQYRLWFAEGSLQEQTELKERLVLLEVENARLEEKNNELLEEIVSLKTSNELIEERAREDLGLIKQGETLYLFPEATSNSAGQVSSQDTLLGVKKERPDGR
jgi:cell division protein FtsB